MKVICHIGQPKTATTLLQSTCVENRAWLFEHGVLYPDTMDPDGNHISLLFACADYVPVFAQDRGISTLDDIQSFRKKLTLHLKDQVERARGQIHTVLLSSENLTANISGPTAIHNLADFLSELFDDVRIVIYLRRQDDSLLSMYSEYMRRGFSDVVFDRFLDDTLNNPHIVPYIFHRRILEFWLHAFGKEFLSVRIFDRAELFGNDILIDFFNIVFSGRIPELSMLRRSSEGNTTLSAPAIEFLRRLQPYIPFEKDGGLNQRREILRGKIGNLPNDPKPRISREQSDRIMSQFTQGNEWVRSTFMPDRHLPLFSNRNINDPSSNLGEISLDEFANLAGILLQ